MDVAPSFGLLASDSVSTTNMALSPPLSREGTCVVGVGAQNEMDVAATSSKRAGQLPLRPTVQFLLLAERACHLGKSLGPWADCSCRCGTRLSAMHQVRATSPIRLRATDALIPSLYVGLNRDLAFGSVPNARHRDKLVESGTEILTSSDPERNCRSSGSVRLSAAGLDYGPWHKRQGFRSGPGGWLPGRA